MTKQSRNFSQQQLTVGLDWGDRSSCYCVLDETGRIIMEQKVSTTPKALQAAFGAMPRSRIALETGMHSPWVSRVPVTALMAWPASIFEMERKVAKQVAAPA